VENIGRDLFDPAARIHKAAEQIPRSAGRVSRKVLQSGPGDRARNALAFGVDRKCEAVPIPPRLRRKHLIPSSFHVIPKIHVSLSLKQQIPDESAVKNVLKYMGTNQRLTSYIACTMAALHWQIGFTAPSGHGSVQPARRASLCSASVIVAGDGAGLKNARSAR